MAFNTTSTAILSAYTHSQLTLFTTHVHPTYFPIAWLDLLGAIRLSYFVDLIVREANGIKQGGESAKGRRPTFAQEAAGILMLIFGGETFLGESRSGRGYYLGTAHVSNSERDVERLQASAGQLGVVKGVGGRISGS
jgi:hypothetical protein